MEDIVSLVLRDQGLKKKKTGTLNNILVAGGGGRRENFNPSHSEETECSINITTMR